MEYKESLNLLEKRTEELYSDVDTLSLHLFPIETLESMKNFYVVKLAYMAEVKSDAFAAFNEAKTALKIILNEKKVHHLQDLSGSDKARIATMYAEKDCKTEMQGVAILENEYKEISNRYSVTETIVRSLTQTISTVKSEMERQQFIKG